MKNFYLLGLLLALLALDTSAAKASDDDFEGFFGEMASDKPRQKYTAHSDDEDAECLDRKLQSETYPQVSFKKPDGTSTEPLKITQLTEGTLQNSSEITLERSDRSSLASSLDILISQKPTRIPPVAYTYVPRSQTHNPFLEEDDDYSDLQSQSIPMASSLPTQSLAAIYKCSQPIHIGGKPDLTKDQDPIDEIQRSQEESKSHRLRSLSKNSTENS